jgi:hypothetical protein
MMKSFALFPALAVAAVLSTSATAQSWDADQTAVWQAIDKTWDVDDVDSAWLSSMTHPKVSGWDTSNPAPRGRDAMVGWAKINRESGKALMVELSPLSITTTESTAIAHYYYSMLTEAKDGKRETEHGYCSDTLIKQDSGWVYLGWNCGELAKK